MPTVVHCLDSNSARVERERSYDAHIMHLRTLIERICFAGPLAIADDARVRGDENLVGSLFVFDASPTETFGLVQRDPYLASGVWERVSVFQTIHESGPWTTGLFARPSGSLYAGLASFPTPRIASKESTLFHSELLVRHSGGGADAIPRRYVSIFTANSLSEARSTMQPDAHDRLSRIEIWALPIAVGTWTMRKLAQS